MKTLFYFNSTFECLSVHLLLGRPELQHCCYCQCVCKLQPLLMHLYFRSLRVSWGCAKNLLLSVALCCTWYRQLKFVTSMVIMYVSACVLVLVYLRSDPPPSTANSIFLHFHLEYRNDQYELKTMISLKIKEIISSN